PPDLPDDLRAQAEMNTQQRMLHIQENMVEFSLSDIYRAAERSRATIYTVIPGIRWIGGSSDKQIAAMKSDTERRLTNATSNSSSNAKRLETIKQYQSQWRVLSPANLAAAAREGAGMQTTLGAVAPPLC